MVIDRVLTIAMDLAIVALVLIVVSQAIGQFDSVLKTVLRPAKDEPVPESVSQWALAPAAVAVAIVALFILTALLAW